jgi:hypothetical protein
LGIGIVDGWELLRRISSELKARVGCNRNGHGDLSGLQVSAADNRMGHRGFLVCAPAYLACQCLVVGGAFRPTGVVLVKDPRRTAT